MLSTKTKKYLLTVLFILAFLITRIPFLGYDEINPDAVNWHQRSEQFIAALKSGDFLKTYQHYHPGVTLMWTMGVPIEIYRQFNPADRIYTADNFIIQHQIAKYSLVLVQLFLSLMLIINLKDILGFKKSFLAITLLSFEPWFLGNSRLLHMDVLLALFMALALTMSYKYLLKPSPLLLVGAGIFSGLSFLTKSVGALTIPVIFIFLVLVSYKKHETAKVIRNTGIFLVVATVTIFVLFPALWVKPKFVLTDIYNEGLRIGTRRGHEQVVMGEQVETAGPGFYPLVLALKTSPIIWAGVGLFLLEVIARRRQMQKVDRYFVLLMFSFSFIYFLGMSAASKKVDRYMVPVFPLLAVISSVAYVQLFHKLEQRYKKRIYPFMITTLAFTTLPTLLAYYPYYFTYTNPLFGSAPQADKILGQKPFGIGMWELRNFILLRYGEVNLGFIDRKPMSTIYRSSKIFDIREYGTSKYDLIVLGPNESIPEKVTEGKYKFSPDYAIYINGLEYWRIYNKTGLNN